MISEPASERVNESTSRRVSESINKPTNQLPITDHRSPITNIQSLIPNDLAAKLHAAREARTMEGERRVVTMLFCDVKGSTEAASHLDPEEWAGIINGAFECMIAPVYRYEGTVARLMGDGLLAFFGAPIAHEDDPLRAVLAGMEIIENIARYKDEVLQQWNVAIDARVGINTGLVVVGAVGSNLQVEYSALGDAINIAARMEQTAVPGTVQISEETQKHIAPLFEFEDLGFVQVKGKAEPVHTFRPLRAKPAYGRTRGIEGLESPIIGRDRELALLRAAQENLSEHGIGSLIFLTGEAGMGKSRLIQELKVEGPRLHAQPLTSTLQPVAWYEIAPLSFEASQPYALFRSFLRQITGIGEMDSPEEARPKLEALAGRLPVEVRGGVTGAFASVLGVLEGGSASDGEAFKRQLFATARETVRLQFSETPGVIVLDDLHWADPASLDIFAHLFPLVETLPILFLCATRPERDAPVWHLKSTLAETYPHRFVEIPVQPLSIADSNVLVDHLLAVADLPPRVRAIMLNKSEGNPFFLEEIIRTLIDEGALVRHEDEMGDGQPHWHIADEEISTIVIPDNLQTLLAARLDRLADDTRRVLQLAAVIGRTFYYRVLQNITGALNGLDGQLSTLQRMNMVVEAARLPELEYAFRHTLVQETAYQSILLKQRKEYHRRVGDAMETLFATRLDEYAPILATHFERAGEEARAFAYFLRAGDVAFRLHAAKEAMAHYTKALDYVRKEKIKTDVCRHLFLRLGRTLEMDGRYDDALAHYLEMEAFGRACESPALELAALVARATIQSAPTDLYNPVEAEALSQKALALAESLDDHATQAKIYWNLMLVNTFRGENEASYQNGLKSLEIARQYNLREQLGYTLNDFQRINMILGNLELSKQYMREAQEIWLELGNTPMYIDSLVSSGFHAMVEGDYVRVEENCLKALKLSQEIGNLWGQSFSQYMLGFVYASQGRIDLAIEVMKNALRLTEPSGFVVPLVDTHAYLGMLYGFLGDFEQADHYAWLALHHATQRLPAMAPGAKSVLAILEYWKGDLQKMEAWIAGLSVESDMTSYVGFLRVLSEGYLLLAKGEYEALMALVESQMPKVDRLGRLVHVSELYWLRGEVLFVNNRMAEARVTALRSLDFSTNSPQLLLQPLQLLSRIEAKTGNEEAAKAYLQQARQNIEIILQNVSDPKLRASFLARPEIRKVMDKTQSATASLSPTPPLP
ncbi:MAG: hypothetical protein Fur0022_32380 [Anaerolineales bacterium]